jgi:hypothetical protein
VLDAALLLWAWVCLPAAAGARTFFLRDVFTTHLPLKAFGAEALRAGRIPAFNPTWGLGQPFRGNPNALPFYPGNLLYLALPFWSAFNLHYALHWLLALAAMAALARGLGQGRAAALVAGLTYAGCGWMLSALTFYNLLAVAAWWPLAMLGAATGGRRGIALGGTACGLAILGGEPVAAALGIVPLTAAAVARLGWRRGAAAAAAVVGLGLAVALPQVVATMRVLAFTTRGGAGLSAAQAATHALHPWRLLELLVPFPFGQPGTIGRQGIWAVAVLPEMPLFLTLYCGVVGLWLAAAAAARQRVWALLAAGGIILAVAAGAAGELLVRASFGMFRFPEKFLFWPALALPLLAGWGLEEVVRAERRAWRTAAGLAGVTTLVLAALLRLASPVALAGVAARLEPLAPAQRAAALALAASQLGAWTIALLIAGAALAAGAIAARQGRVAALAALQLALLAQLYPLAATDSTAPYRAPAPWARLAGGLAGGVGARGGGGASGAGSRAGAAGTERPAVVNELLEAPRWRADPGYRLPEGSRAVVERMKALDLAPAPGVLHGLTYPLAPDLEGTQSPLSGLMLAQLPRLGWRARARWFRSVGLTAAVLYEDPAEPDLRLLGQAERHGVASRLYAVRDPAPRAWWPRQLTPAPTPRDALAAVAGAADPVAAVAVPRLLPHDPGGRLLLLAEAPDRIELEVAGSGGVAVVRRAYQPLYRASTAGRPLPTFPVNLDLLGIAVPAGRHRIEVTVSAWPEALAGLAALLALAGALAAASPYSSRASVTSGRP